MLGYDLSVLQREEGAAGLVLLRCVFQGNVDEASRETQESMNCPEKRRADYYERKCSGRCVMHGCPNPQSETLRCVRHERENRERQRIYRRRHHVRSANP